MTDLMVRRVTQETYFASQSTEYTYLPDETNIRAGRALLVGPEGTPYAGALFFFSVTLPLDYPLGGPPKMFYHALESTKRHPNLYADGSGKVCLSILGTWSGPAWTPVLTLHTTLMSVLSLLCGNAYTNEPGNENLDPTSDQARLYDAKARESSVRSTLRYLREGDAIPYTAGFSDAVLRAAHAHGAAMAAELAADTGFELLKPDGVSRRDALVAELRAELAKLPPAPPPPARTKKGDAAATVTAAAAASARASAVAAAT